MFYCGDASTRRRTAVHSFYEVVVLSLFSHSGPSVTWTKRNHTK